MDAGAVLTGSALPPAPLRHARAEGGHPLSPVQRKEGFPGTVRFFFRLRSVSTGNPVSRRRREGRGEETVDAVSLARNWGRPVTTQEWLDGARGAARITGSSERKVPRAGISVKKMPTVGGIFS